MTCHNEKTNKVKLVYICLLCLLIFQGGCAANKVVCPWGDNDITANGYDDEWQGVPQYYDKDRQVAIRLFNNAEALFMCVSIGEDGLKRQVQKSGMTVWLDPLGGKKQTFGIHFPGGELKRHEWRPRPNPGEGRPIDDRSRPMDNNGRQPSFEPLKELEIIDGVGTDPVQMTILDFQRTGICVGAGQSSRGRLVYEFIIGLEAAESLSGLKPGMVAGIGVQTSASKSEGRKEAPSGGKKGRGGPGSGGGMGGHGSGGGPRAGGRTESFNLWLQVRLAEGL